MSVNMGMFVLEDILLLNIKTTMQSVLWYFDQDIYSSATYFVEISHLLVTVGVSWCEFNALLKGDDKGYFANVCLFKIYISSQYSTWGHPSLHTLAQNLCGNNEESNSFTFFYNCFYFIL